MAYVSRHLEEALSEGESYPSDAGGEGDRLTPGDLKKQRKGIERAVRDRHKKAKISASEGTPGDWTIRVPGPSSISTRNAIDQIDRVVRNLGYQTIVSSDGLRVYVFAETPASPDLDEVGDS